MKEVGLNSPFHRIVPIVQVLMFHFPFYLVLASFRLISQIQGVTGSAKCTYFNAAVATSLHFKLPLTSQISHKAPENRETQSLPCFFFFFLGGGVN